MQLCADRLGPYPAKYPMLGQLLAMSRIICLVVNNRNFFSSFIPTNRFTKSDKIDHIVHDMGEYYLTLAILRLA